MSVILIFVLLGCREKNPKLHRFSGVALGTNYTVKFFSDRDFAVEKSLDSIFRVMDQALSNYQEHSDISRLNKGDTSIVVDRNFQQVFSRSKTIYKSTDGYFDPTIGSLVRAYGFGAQKPEVAIDSAIIDSLMQFVGFDKVNLTPEHKIVLKDPRIYLDFNAIGKGYAVDRVGLYLEDHGVWNYLVEIGGEFRASGKNLNRDESWRLGISDPRVGKFNRLTATVYLENKAMATSGNYRHFRKDSVTGQKFTHIINPKSGYMQKRNLQSATVIADDCATADAYATAFMVMGLKKAKKLSRQLKNKGIDVFFIFNRQGHLKTYSSPGFLEMADSIAYEK